LKETYEVVQYNILIFLLALALNEHGLKMPILTTSPPHFSAHNFLSAEPYQPLSIPPMGGGTLSQGAQNSSPVTT